MVVEWKMCKRKLLQTYKMFLCGDESTCNIAVRCESIDGNMASFVTLDLGLDDEIPAPNVKRFLKETSWTVQSVLPETARIQRGEDFLLVGALCCAVQGPAKGTDCMCWLCNLLEYAVWNPWCFVGAVGEVAPNMATKRKQLHPEDEQENELPSERSALFLILVRSFLPWEK